MAAAGVLMHANIKFAGDLILQVFGDGPVKLAVAEIGADLAFRVTATVTGAVADDAGLAAMLNVHGGGRCAITLAPRRPGPASSPIKASCRCTATPASRCRRSRRCSSTTCCSRSSSTRGSCSPPTSASPPACCCSACRRPGGAPTRR